MAKVTTIQCGIMSQNAANKVHAAVHGKSFMNFRVDQGITPSGVNVTISTEYEDEFAEIAGMVVFLMASAK